MESRVTAGVEAVDRALKILCSLEHVPNGQTLSRIAAETGLYKSTILRISASLERVQFVVRAADGRFCLGPAIGRLATTYRQSIDPTGEIRNELKRLVSVTGETASFYIRDGDFRVCLLRENSPRALRHHLNEGDRLPLGKGASGLVLAKDSETNSRGYAISLGARDPDLAAVAVPFITEKGRLHGALAVSGPLVRFGPDLCQSALTALLDGAARLAKLLI